MAKKTCIEVALNGAWTRRLQPNIPVTAEEIITEGVACIKAGAAVIHAHTLEPDTGKQNNNLENCIAFIGGIRSQADAIVYPTAAPIPLPDDWSARYATTGELVKRGLCEWGFLDPGSRNFYLSDASAPPLFGGDGGVYSNPNGALELGIELAAKHKYHPAYACYKPGFVRQGATLHRKQPTAPVAIYRMATRRPEHRARGTGPHRCVLRLDRLGGHTSSTRSRYSILNNGVPIPIVTPLPLFSYKTSSSKSWACAFLRRTGNLKK